MIEQVLGDPDTDTPFSAESDITMMVLLGGKERTREWFCHTVGSGGSPTRDVVYTPTSFSLLIARPRNS